MLRMRLPGGGCSSVTPVAVTGNSYTEERALSRGVR